MNRIVLIGNGFDLAHGLKTGYRDFADWYWMGFAQKYPKSSDREPCEDEFVKLENINGPKGGYSAYLGEKSGDPLCKASISFVGKVSNITSYKDLKQLMSEAEDTAGLTYKLSFHNAFWEHISEKSCLETWVDIENEYYSLLKSHLTAENRNERVKKLNKEFGQVKNLLEKYLTEVCENELSNIEPNNDILNEIFLGKGIESRCVAVSRQEHYESCVPEQKQKMSKMVRNIVQYEDEHGEQKKIQAMMTQTPYRSNPLCKMNEEEQERFIEQLIKQFGVIPDHTLVLNFNYTSTFERLYSPELSLFEIINIHGELNNPDNSIIFGYGDELDGDYKEIERANDNDLLDNIKHIQYPNTDNYRRFLEFLQLGSYQVSVLGHSCGNSDRTLLNTIFEHSNCLSVRPFYYQWRNRDTGAIEDNYMELYKNISRNFNDKKALRDIVVNKECCTPLVPVAAR